MGFALKIYLSECFHSSIQLPLKRERTYTTPMITSQELLQFYSFLKVFILKSFDLEKSYKNSKKTSCIMNYSASPKCYHLT